MPHEAQENLLPDPPPDSRWETVQLSRLASSELPSPPDAFITSVRRFGVIQPIILRQAHGVLSLVDGRRRLAAARDIGLTEIPALIMQSTNSFGAAVSLIANTQRSPNPRAEYQAIDTLVRDGRTTAEIAQMLSLPVRRVERRYVISRLIPSLLSLYHAGHISHATALAATQLDAEAQSRCVQLRDTSGRLTTADVQTAVRMQREQQQTLYLPEQPRQTVVVGPSPEYVLELEAEVEQLRTRLRQEGQDHQLTRIERDQLLQNRPNLTRQQSPLTAVEARDAVVEFLRSRVHFSDGTTLSGRINNTLTGPVFELTVRSQASAPGYDRMMRSVRALGSPQRQVLRQRLLEILGETPTGDWGEVVGHLRTALAFVPNEDENADAAYQHIMAAFLEVAQMAGITIVTGI